MLPNACTVLCGIPSSEEEFHAALAQQPRTDYADHITLGGALSPELAWGGENGYSRVATALAQFLDKAQVLGAIAVRRATLSDLKRATAMPDQTVILIAHWRGEAVRTSDLLVDADAIKAKLSAANSPLSALVSERLATLPGPVSRSRVASVLNSVVTDGSLLTVLPPNARAFAGASDTLLRALSRDALDELLYGCVRPGNMLELQDGLYPPGDISDAIAEKYSGDIDLSACQSVVLAEVLRRRADITPVVISNNAPLLPTARFILLHEALRHWSVAEGRYATRRLEVEKAIVADERLSLKTAEKMFRSPGARRKLIEQEMGMGLKRVLVKHRHVSGTLGGSQSSDGEGLERDIRSFRTRQILLYFMMVVFIISVFGIAIYSAYKAVLEPKLFAPTLAGLAAAVAASIEFLRRMTTEWARSSMLLVVLNNADQNQKQAVIEKLIARL